jgi:isopentenyl diphosphate isomerase/L-lactate dehydrogenase-like FMN-dependent dehydrogenase
MDGKYCNSPLGLFGRQTVADLKGYAAATKLPFILKGILNASDAEKCVEIGAGAIIVSNHNNRFPSAVPPLAALPEIKKAVGGRFPVLVDGCIESGVEAYKALALGADGVLVCRAFMKAFAKGPEAVTDKLNAITAELAGCMANTGARDLAHISSDSLCRRAW